MAEKVAVGLDDAALTPESPGTPAVVTRTFTPGEMENGYVHTFYNTNTGTTPASRSKVTASISVGDTVSRVKFAIALPKATTVDGVVKVDHVTRCFCEFVLPANCSRDDRRDVKALLNAILANSTFKEMVDNLEDLW